METGDYYIDFQIDDDWDDCECPLSLDELERMGVSVDRRDVWTDEWILWN